MTNRHCAQLGAAAALALSAQLAGLDAAAAQETIGTAAIVRNDNVAISGGSEAVQPRFTTDDADVVQTLTMVVEGHPVSFDFSGSNTETLLPVMTQRTATFTGGWTARDIAFDFGRRGEGQSRLVVFDGPGYRGVVSVLKDPDSRPAVPTQGKATFDTALTGVFRDVQLPFTEEQIVGRGVVRADFGDASISGKFRDIDFIVDGVRNETTQLGHDFGIEFDGFVLPGEDAQFGMGPTRTTPRPGQSGAFLGMTGSGAGYFVGPEDGAPTGIAGTFELRASDEENIAALVGGFEGVKRGR